MFIYFVHNGFFEKLTRFCEPSCLCVSISNPFTLQRAAFTCESLVLGWGPCSAVRPGVPRRLHVQLLGSVPRTSLCSVKPFPCGQLRSVSGLTSAGARGLPSACTRLFAVGTALCCSLCSSSSFYLFASLSRSPSISPGQCPESREARPDIREGVGWGLSE